MRRLSSKKKTPAQGDAGAANSSSKSKDSKKTPPKKRAQAARDSEEDSESDALGTFEVDSIVGSRIIRGQQQYKVHWKGYPSSKDTWEIETNLTCDDLVKKYLKESGEDESQESDAKTNGASKRKSSEKAGRESKKSRTSDNGTEPKEDEAKESVAKSSGSAKKNGSAKEEGRSRKSNTSDNGRADDSEEDDEEEVSLSNRTPKRGKKSKSENASESSPSTAPKKSRKKAEPEEEFEVDQIVDCVPHGGKRYFLVRWKGYGSADDSWEIESNLKSSKDLVDEYLTSHPIDEEREDGKKTRENPKKTKAFAVGPTGRRQSRRAHGRSRATYFDQE